MSTFTTN